MRYLNQVELLTVNRICLCGHSLTNLTSKTSIGQLSSAGQEHGYVCDFRDTSQESLV